MNLIGSCLQVLKMNCKLNKRFEITDCIGREDINDPNNIKIMKKKKIYDKINHNVQIWETIKIILGRVPYKTDNLNEIINNNTKTLGKSWEKQILKLKKLELTAQTK